MIRDSWFTIQKIDHTTFAISEYGHWEKVHSFLLIGDEQAILIDTGLGIDCIKRVTDQLTDLPITVLTTHVHVDHIGGHGEFDTIYVHEKDSDWLINGIKGLSMEKIRMDIGRDITIPTPRTFNPETYTPYQGELTEVVVDDFHSTLGLDPIILEEVRLAVKFLREKELVKFGTGIHTFNGFSVQF